MAEREDWIADDWAAARRRSFTRGLLVSATQRVAWLEEMIRLAWSSGALPHRRAENGERIPRASAPSGLRRERP